MKFDTNDLVYAYLTMQDIETIEPVGETVDYCDPEDQLDDLRRFHNQLDTLFYEFG